SATRSAALPNVPTMVEAGVADFVVESFVVVMAPAGTPQPIVQRLNDEMLKAWLTPEGQRLLAGLNMELAQSKPLDIANFLTSERVRWSKLIHEANIKTE
ncbi:MAG: tripartite tricarboxylate transporter substrate-binding protein, partial [Betaproteobacteria bacterium]